MTSNELCDLFDAWWQESFPHAPCNKQTRENMVAFGSHVEKAIYASMFPADRDG